MGSDCSHCSFTLQLQLCNFWGGGGSDCSHCSFKLQLCNLGGWQSLRLQFHPSTSTLQVRGWGGGGSNCSHCSFTLQLQLCNFGGGQGLTAVTAVSPFHFNFASSGVGVDPTAVTAASPFNFATLGGGGGLTAVTAVSPFNFNLATLGGGGRRSDCSHCSFNFQLQLWNFRGVPPFTQLPFSPTFDRGGDLCAPETFRA